jgi:hypothetical protein
VLAPDPYAPPPNPYGMPSTGYGSGTPPPPTNPYNVPPAPTPYGAPGYDPNNPGAYGAGAPYGVQPPYVPHHPKKGPNGCVIAAIIVISLFVLIVGSIVALGAFAVNKASQTFNSSISSIDATATADIGTANALSTPTGISSSLPSSSQIDPTAESNLSNAQTSTSVDSTTFEPTNVTSNFSLTDTIYITYDLSGKAGYVIEKTYTTDGNLALESNSPHPIASDDTNGYISFSLGNSGSYVTGLYWCNQSDCSDAALAQVVTFTIS